MPAYLDFDSSKKFRDSILNRTLQVPNGPQTFTSKNYLVNMQNDFANVDPGDVVKSTDFNRELALTKTQAKNLADLDPEHIYENQNDFSVTDPGDVIKSTDFNRDFSLTKTQTKNLADLDPEHIYENQNDFSVTDPGDVIKSTDFNRDSALAKAQGKNLADLDAEHIYENQNDYSVTDPGDVIKSTDFNRTESLKKTQGLNQADLDAEHIYKNQNTFPVKDPGDVENVIGEFKRSESLKKSQGKNLSKLDPTHIYENQNEYSVVDAGSVESVPGAEVQPFIREKSLEKLQNTNIYSPEDYFILSDLRTYVRSIKKIEYTFNNFESKSKFHNIVSMSTTTDYENETDLFKFAYDYILKQNDGPLRQRIEQNVLLATVGRANFLDIFSNTGSALVNIITGKESLIEYNYKITVDSSLSGKAVDFLQVVAGVEFPFSEIPGNYLTNPDYEVTNSLTTGINRLFGIHTKNQVSSHPSDLMVEYMGEGQKRRLYDGLRLNKYSPNYSKSARNGDSNTLNNFINNVAKGVSNLLTGDAPNGVSYIGDDRNNSVSNINNSYQLAIFFDENLKKHTGGEKNVDEGGSIAGTLTWYSSKGTTKLGHHLSREATENDLSLMKETLSTKFTFRDDSILGKTQEILDSGIDLTGNDKISHISNVIDQTSRIFKEGEQMLSRGSAVLYTGFTRDGVNSPVTGEEYCRVWTKDKGYTQYKDLVRKNGLIRKFKNSVIDSTYNLNIAPLSGAGGRNYEGSTNIINDGTRDGFYAKKYMFSIENLAWKTSNTPNFQYNDLPHCEKGNNGGRVMWFPPYNLKVSEQNQAKWNDNDFIGRPEPIYTYINTTRDATISFNVIVDHPSIMNFLIHDFWKSIGDDKQADEFIHSFFAGCIEDSIDFYSMLLTYPQLTKTELETVYRYITGTKDKNTITKFRTIIDPVEGTQSDTTVNGDGEEAKTDGTEVPETVEYYFYYKNDIPGPNGEGYYSTKPYSDLYKSYFDQKEADLATLDEGIDEIWPTQTTLAKNEAKNDLNHLCGRTSFDGLDKENTKTTVKGQLTTAFNDLKKTYDDYFSKLTELKAGLADGSVVSISTNIDSSCSAVADDGYNLDLSFRRSHSIILDILENLKKDGTDVSKLFSWPVADVKGKKTITFSEKITIPMKDLGYENNDGSLIITGIKNDGEQGETGKGAVEVNVECSDKNFAYKKLKSTAPLAFYCRKSIIKLTAVKKVPLVGGQNNPPEQSGSGGGGTNTTIESYEETVANVPTIDEVKKIIMKILAECYYFKVLKEDSPMVYSSLRERLKYFTPAFHSMTPEGLNERLTFLQQCIRPGDTIPVKGLNDLNDMNARNTSFGPPPICVLRIGDFFHSKMIIRTVNISYDDSLWDFNPEGVGMQPMLAKVDLSVSLIGGHGLEKPVERLQNALSFNFYGNTEIFDHRSTATEDRMPFYKSDIEKIIYGQTQEASKPTVKTDINASEKILTGNYIGELVGAQNSMSLSYDKIIQEVYEYADEYICNYQNAFMDINTNYGAKIASMFLSPTYRKNYTYEVQTSAGTTDIELLGEYDSNNSLFSYSTIFGLQMTNKLEEVDLTTLIGINLGANTSSAKIIIDKYAKKTIDDVVNMFTQINSVKAVEKSRNKLILVLDKLNFVIEIGHDATLYDLRSAKAVNFSEFDEETLYSKYSKVITYVNDNTIQFKTLFDENHDFSYKNLLMDDVTFSEFLGILWKDKLQDILKTFSNNSNFANAQSNDILNKKIGKFISSAVSKINVSLENNIPMEDCPILSNNNPVEFTIVDENYTLSNDELTKLNLVLSLNNFSIDNILNYYRKNG